MFHDAQLAKGSASAGPCQVQDLQILNSQQPFLTGLSVRFPVVFLTQYSGSERVFCMGKPYCINAKILGRAVVNAPTGGRLLLPSMQPACGLAHEER